MNLRDFYKFHGLSRVKFANLVGISYKTLMSYESGADVTNETKLRIEIGMEIIEEWGIQYITHTSGAAHSLAFYGDNDVKDRIFKNLFNRAILLEL